TLLGQYGVMPSIGLIWTVGLAVTGVLTFVSNGFNKSSFVLGSFFLLASVLSILRQQNLLDISNEISIIFMSLGVLTLANRSDVIPEAPDTTHGG
ncbi:MAG: hypothetical protein VB859_20950, partial [Planctomycetaceae bacterium]